MRCHQFVLDAKIILLFFSEADVFLVWNSTRKCLEWTAKIAHLNTFNYDYLLFCLNFVRIEDVLCNINSTVLVCYLRFFS